MTDNLLGFIAIIALAAASGLALGIVLGRRAGPYRPAEDQEVQLSKLADRLDKNTKDLNEALSNNPMAYKSDRYQARK